MIYHVNKIAIKLMVRVRLKDIVSAGYRFIQITYKNVNDDSLEMIGSDYDYN